MKRVIKRSRIAAIVLALTVVFCTSVTDATSTADGSEFELVLPEKQYAEIDYASVAAVLYGYFSEYHKSIEALDVSPKLMRYVVDTENTHLYLRALQYGINWRKAMNTGIADSRVNEIDLKHVRPLPDGSVEIRAYIRISYRYLEDEANTIAHSGDFWEIRIGKVGDTPKIVYLSSQSNDYHTAKQRIQEKMIKNAQSQGYTITDAIDDAYDEINAFIPQLVVLADASNATSENKDTEDIAENNVIETRSVAVTYDYARARNFAHAKGASYQTQIFKR